LPANLKKIHKNQELKIKDQIINFAKMIKFSHTVFALPFALSAVVMALKNHKFIILDLIWIIFAMVGARSAAMGFNRIVDALLDKKNPRTSAREIPLKILTKKQTGIFVILSSIVFIFSALMLGKLCFFLCFPVLFFLFFYSYTKRFTKFCHIYLGFGISLAPIGAFIAITNTLSLSVIFLSLALMTYIAGFDILYACQDIDFDKKENLFSIPVKYGIKKSMKISCFFHVFMIIFLLCLHISFQMKPVFLLFIFIIGILLFIEHKIVQPDNLKNINIAFFHINSLVSIVLFTGIFVESLI